jgi:hypothetical protein
MTKYLIVISNSDGTINYTTPSELYAKNKQEAKSLILENIDEQYIAGIYTVDEYKKFIQSPQFRTLATNSSDFAAADANGHGSDFMNNMIASATAYAEFMQNAEKEDMENQRRLDAEKEYLREQKRKQANMNLPAECLQEKPKEPVKYFIDNGIQYKIDNGDLYKKVWKPVEIDEHMNDDGQCVYPEFRIVNKETGKQIKSTKYQVQQLVWELLQIN